MSEPKFADNLESDVICPECPIDPPKLRVKTNRANGNQFLGCPNWPECHYTTGIPESWKMRLAGQKELL